MSAGGAALDHVQGSHRNLRVVVPRHGGPDVLQVIEEALPEPGPGEVRVHVRAAGVSAYDLMFRRSRLMPGMPRLPFTPGEDVVGVVDALGAATEGIEVGQLVAGTTLSLGVGGGYAAYVCLPERELVPVPDGVDPAEAVCVVINYLTAFSALHQVAKVRRGERMLVQGAAGGVGTALLDLGRLAGLEMYGTASADHLEIVEGYGARSIDYRAEPVVRRVHELTGTGVDVAFDPVGGARQLWRSYRTLGEGGRLVWFGIAAHKRSGIAVIPASLLTIALLRLRRDRRRALTSVDYAKDNDWYRRTLAMLLDHLAMGELRPTVADRIPLPEAARAHELLEHGSYAGKVVLIAEP
jgi:NADPH2:quinone reductase